MDEEASSRTCKSKHVVGKINKAELNEVQTTEKNKNEKRNTKKVSKSKRNPIRLYRRIRNQLSFYYNTGKKGIKAKTAIKSKSWADMAEEEDEESVVGIIGKATDNSTEDK